MKQFSPDRQRDPSPRIAAVVGPQQERVDDDVAFDDRANDVASLLVREPDAQELRCSRTKVAGPEWTNVLPAFSAVASQEHLPSRDEIAVVLVPEIDLVDVLGCRERNGRPRLAAVARLGQITSV